MDTRSTRLAPLAAVALASAAIAFAAVALIAVVAAGMEGVAAAAPGKMMGGGPGYGSGGMMGGGPGYGSGPQPGTPGFVAGTTAAPRVVRVDAGPRYRFAPSRIRVVRGETITFVVTTMGPVVHEFIVGPADAVAADRAGTPEIAYIGMMQAKSLTYAFTGSGPYTFACHAAGHYQAGMRGTITLVP